MAKKIFVPNLALLVGVLHYKTIWSANGIHSDLMITKGSGVHIVHDKLVKHSKTRTVRIASTKYFCK